MLYKNPLFLLLLLILFLFQDKELPTFKDNDFLSENKKLYIGKEAKDKMLAKLKKDIEVRPHMVWSGYGRFFWYRCGVRFGT